MRVRLALLALMAVLTLVRLRLQQDPAAGRGGQGRLGGGAEPVPAPRRPDPEPGQHGQGLRGAGAGGADRRDRGARQGRLDPGDAGADRRSGGVRSSSRRRRASCRSALSRLLVVVENYPDLKSDQNFRDLQAQLEGTENRITVARNRYIEAVQDYNITVRSFPTNLTAMMFGYKPKPNFTVENEAAIAEPPTVDFGTAPAPARSPTAPRRPEVAAGIDRHARCWRTLRAAARRRLLRWLLRVAAAGAQAQVAVPPLTRAVTDLTGTLTPSSSAALEQQLAALRSSARAASSRC